MDHLRWERRPTLRRPVIVAAFEGWNDAGDASTTALRHLCESWRAEAFATIDPEEFFDFTSVRPTVTLEDGHQREVRWPRTELHAATLPELDHDVVLVLGVEPQLRWRTFAAQLTAVADACDARFAITLGALLAEVPHSRPVTIIGSSTSDELIADVELTASSYEGPTGIVAVVHDAMQQAGVEAATLWAEVPTYVPAAPSPKAALALVRAVASMLSTRLETTGLEISAEAYERQITELVAADDDTSQYVERLERLCDEEGSWDRHPEGARLVEELERYLRDRRSD